MVASSSARNARGTRTAALEKRIQAQLRTGKGMLKVRECGVDNGTPFRRRGRVRPRAHK